MNGLIEYSVRSPLQIPNVGGWGIDLVQLHNRFEGVAFSAQTYNGLKTFCKMKQEEILFEDLKGYYVGAEIKDDALYFHLMTRGGMGSKRSDFRAGKFMPFAIEFFRMNSELPSVCIGAWVRNESINFDQFTVRYNPLRDNRVEAAFATWSGRNFAKNGFDSLRHQDVQFYSHSGLPLEKWSEQVEFVNAAFYR